METKPNLRVTLLGRFSANYGDGRTVSIATQKNEALFAATLLAGDTGIRRELVASMLWSRSPDAQARANLRQALASLRKALEPADDLISARSDLLSVKRDNLWVDADELMAADQQKTALDPAILLAMGPFLHEINVKEPPFEEWLDSQRAYLSAALTRVTDLTARLEIESGRYGQAEQLARKLLSIDGYSEAAHRLLMSAHSMQGELAGALRHFETMRHLFRSDLGIEPSEETLDFVASLRAKNPGAANTAKQQASDALPDKSYEPPQPEPPAESSERGALKTVVALSGQIAPPGFDAIGNAAEVRRWRDCIARVIASFEATLLTNTGASFQALFGVPVSHSKDAERCIECARQIARDLGADGGMPGMAEVRLAAVAGSVIAEPVSVGAIPSLIGDPAQQARNLLVGAETGWIVVDDGIRHALASRFPLQAVSEGIWKLSIDGASGRVFDQPAFVGRDSEFSRIATALHDAADNRQGEVLVLRGEAGIGKTRLTEEVSRYAAENGYRLEQSRVLDFGQGRGQGAASQLSRAFADVAQMVLGGAEQSVFRDLAALELADEDRAALAELNREGLAELRARVLGKLLKEAARTSPVVVTIEDVHWAEPGLLHILADMAGEFQESPVVMILTTRPANDPIDNAWRMRCPSVRISTIDIPPLRKAAATALAGSLGQLPPDLLENCLDRAEGNPLFIEQLVRGSSQLANDQLPLSVQSVVQEQLDALPWRLRDTLQTAAVFGQVVSFEALSTICGAGCAGVDELCATHLVRQRGSELNFVHALVRDGAYGSISPEDRLRLHLAAAQWFEGKEIALWARHLDEGGSPKAGTACREAAEFERREGRLESAAVLAGRAVQLATGDEEKDIALLVLAKILRDSESFEEAISTFSRISPENHGVLPSAKFGTAECFFRLDRHDQSWQALDEAERLCREAQRSDWMALVACLRAGIQFARGNCTSSVSYSKQASSAAEKSGNNLLRARAISTTADAEVAAGLFVSAEKSYAHCARICRENGYHRYAASNEKMVADMRFYDGDFAASREILLRVLDEATSIGSHRTVMLAEHMLSYVDSMEGRYEQAYERVERARALVEKLSARRFLMNNSCFAAMSLGGMGKNAEALELLSEAEETARSLNVTWVLPWVLAERAKLEPTRQLQFEALDTADGLVAAGTVTYPFDYYRAAMDAALALEDWDRAIAYADRLDAYFAAEPVGLPVLVSDMARAVSAAADGHSSPVSVSDVRQRAKEMNYHPTLLLLGSQSI